MEILKVAWATKNAETGQLDSSTLYWTNETMAEVDKKISISDWKDSLTAIFYPGDVKGKGCPLDRNIEREIFEKDPIRYGVIYHKRSAGLLCFE